MITRKNPWYMAILIVFQMVAGIYFLSKAEPQLFVGGFLLWAGGMNCGYSFAGNPPDMV